MAVEIEIKGEAEIIKMQPGDVLLVKFDCPLTRDSIQWIKQHLEEELPGVRTIVAGENVTFSILRPELGEALPNPEHPLHRAIRRTADPKLFPGFDVR